MASAHPVSRKRTRTEAMCNVSSCDRPARKTRRIGGAAPRWKRGRDAASDTAVLAHSRPAKRHCKVPANGEPVTWIYTSINTLLRTVHFERHTCHDDDDDDDDDDDMDESDGEGPVALSVSPPSCRAECGEYGEYAGYVPVDAVHSDAMLVC